MNDSLGKKKQVHASDNEPSREILSRSNTCESFPDQGGKVVTLPDSEGTQAGDSVDLHENNATAPLDQSSSFPEAAQAFVEAIRRNRAYQKFLRKKLTEIEAKIVQNEKHQKNVKIVVDFQASCKRITKQALSQGRDPRLQLISTPKCGPRDSSEVKHFDHSCLWMSIVLRNILLLLLLFDLMDNVTFLNLCLFSCRIMIKRYLL